MALVGTVDPLFNYAHAKVFDVTAAADGDTGPDLIAHGLGVAPDVVIIQEQLCLAAAADGFISEGAPADATNITLTKQGSVGSAGGVPGTTVIARVLVAIPHSLFR